MEIKAVKTKDGLLLSGAIPPELASSEALEIFPLRDGAYLLTVRGFVGAPAGKMQREGGAKGALGEKEKELVRKLLAVRFENRIPAAVNRTLTKEEKETLAELMEKKMVQILHGGKYEQGGVYNISDFAFNSVKEPQQGANAVQPHALSASSPEHLESMGWMVLDDEMSAKNFASAFPQKVKAGEVRGVRAFDRKFYFVTSAFMESHEKEVQSSLGRGEKTAEEIAAELALPPEGCRALLLHLAEAGEVLEKHKGKFARA